MNITTLEILWRAESAEPESPIAVFKNIGKYRTTLRCVFASTIATRKRINAGDPSLVGIYDKTTDPSQIKNDIKNVFG